MAQSAGQTGPVETMLAADAASQMLGIELVDHGEGWARTRMTVRDDMVNGHGMCHGGLIFSLADTAFACACNSWGPVTVAAGCDIVFVAPASRGDVLLAEARARARYGRNGVYDVAVTRGDELIAEFRGRSHQIGRLPRPFDAVHPSPRCSLPDCELCSQQVNGGIKHRPHCAKVRRGGTVWHTTVPGDEGHMHLHLSPAAVRVDDSDPLTHPDFADRLDLGVIIEDGHAVDCVRWYQHQLSGAALQTLLTYRDPDPPTQYPPDFIALMAVQSDT